MTMPPSGRTSQEMAKAPGLSGSDVLGSVVGKNYFASVAVKRA
jgi:hypothetical protein